MTEFKVGDRVRFKKERGVERDTTTIHTITRYDYFVYVDGITSGWFPHRFELVTTIGFEVGKTYKFNVGGLDRYIVEFVSPITGAALANWTGRSGEKKATALVEFANYTEVIPPPPEEWRIMYKSDHRGIEIGVTPFTSDDEARKSAFWTGTAFKTIRVDS